MDFDSDIEAARQVLLRSTYVYNQLPEEERFQRLCEQIIPVLNKTEACNRKNIFLFILLNSDANYVDNVAEDENFSHLIDTIPRLDHTLVLRVILETGGVHFLQELVTFAPPAMSFSVLNSLCNLNDIKTKPTFAVTELANACFHKLYLSNENIDIACSFAKLFKQCLTENFDWLKSVSEIEWKACRAIHILSICAFCMKNSFGDQTHAWSGFMMKCSMDKTSDCGNKDTKSHSLSDIIEECRELIIKYLLGILMELTLDDWLCIAEIQSESYQEKIRNLGIAAKQVLKNCGIQKKLFENTPLIEALEFFTPELHREEETTSGPDTETIKLMLTDNTTKNQKWMKEFLNFNCILQDETNLAIIESNCDLLDDNDVELLFENVVSLLYNGSINDDVSERLKCLSYRIIKTLPLQKIVSVHKNFTEKYGLSAVMRSKDFTALLRSAFNKTTFRDEESINEWQREYFALSMMDFTEFVKEALIIALENSDLAYHLSKVFSLMLPMSEQVVPEILFQIAQKLSGNSNKVDNFPGLVQKLAQQNVLREDLFFKKYASSSIHHAITINDWSSVFMWINTLYPLLPNLYAPGSCNNVVILIVYFIQIMEHSQQCIDKFSMKCVQSRERTIALLEKLNTIELNENALKWLKSYHFEFSLLTKCYIEVFCSADTINHKFAGAYELCFRGHVKTPESTSYILFEMLPSLSSYEWKSIADVLKKLFTHHSDPAYSVFQSFYHAVLLLLFSCSKVDYETCPNYLSCLNYSISCFADILKLKVLPELQTSNTFRVLEESLHFLNQLPQEVWMRGGMDVLPELINLIGQVPLKLHNFNELFSIMSKYPINEGSVLLKKQLQAAFEGNAEGIGKQDVTE